MPPDKLTDTTIRNAKPGAKPMRLSDGGGLYFDIAPTGGKPWRWKFRSMLFVHRRGLDIQP